MNRTRTSPAIVSYGLYLYFSSRSFRLAAKCLSSYIKRSHVAIWKWVQKYSDCADRFLRTDKRLVRVIFVDETLLQIDGKDHWLWIAYEPYLSSCLMMHLSRERTIFVCYQFFKQLRCRYGRRPIFTDGAQWYNNASADGSDWSTICMVLSWRTLWKGSSSISRTERNVSMTIFLAGKKRIVTDSMSGTGWSYLYCTCILEWTGCYSWRSWQETEVKLTEPKKTRNE